MKSRFFILIILATLLGCHPSGGNVWTKEYEAKTYHDIEVSLAPVVKNAEQRKLLIDFTIQRLKKQLPLGLESISADSLHRLCFKIGEEYTYTKRLHSSLPWTAINEESLRIKLEQQTLTSIPDQNKRNKFCNCLIAQLKQHQPDSIRLPIPDTTMTAIASSCVVQ